MSLFTEIFFCDENLKLHKFYPDSSHAMKVKNCLLCNCKICDEYFDISNSSYKNNIQLNLLRNFFKENDKHGIPGSFCELLILLSSISKISLQYSIQVPETIIFLNSLKNVVLIKTKGNGIAQVKLSDTLLNQEIYKILAGCFYKNKSKIYPSGSVQEINDIALIVFSDGFIKRLK